MENAPEGRNLGKSIAPECGLYLKYLEDRRFRKAVKLFMDLMNNNPAYKTLSGYEGMGHWFYVHKKSNSNLFQLYVAESGELKDILKEIVEPFDFYTAEMFDEENGDYIFVGVDKGTTNNEIETEWKNHRMGIWANN